MSDHAPCRVLVPVDLGYLRLVVDRTPVPVRRGDEPAVMVTPLRLSTDVAGAATIEVEVPGRYTDEHGHGLCDDLASRERVVVEVVPGADGHTPTLGAFRLVEPPAPEPSPTERLRADLTATAADLARAIEQTKARYARSIPRGFEGEPVEHWPSVFEALDANGRPVLADMLAARANALAALAALPPPPPEPVEVLGWAEADRREAAGALRKGDLRTGRDGVLSAWMGDRWAKVEPHGVRTLSDLVRESEPMSEPVGGRRRRVWPL